MSAPVSPDDLLADLNPLVLKDGQHLRGVILIALVDDVNVEHEANLHVVSSPELNFWSQLGMLLDATDGMRTMSWREPKDET